MRMPRFTFTMPAWAMLFLWPVYVLAFLIWLTVAMLLLSVAVIEWTVRTLIKVFAEASKPNYPKGNY